MQIGSRFIFDQDGEILCRLGEMQGDALPRKEITKLDFIDMEYGQIDCTNHKIKSINVETKQPILEDITTPKSEEQLKIEELENQLLLMADSLEGGIL